MRTIAILDTMSTLCPNKHQVVQAVFEDDDGLALLVHAAAWLVWWKPDYLLSRLAGVKISLEVSDRFTP